jgi:hypothetical protein
MRLDLGDVLFLFMLKEIFLFILNFKVLRYVMIYQDWLIWIQCLFSQFVLPWGAYFLLFEIFFNLITQWFHNFHFFCELHEYKSIFLWKCLQLSEILITNTY